MTVSGDLSEVGDAGASGLTADAGDRPEWAEPYAVLVELEQRGAKHKVPPSVKARYENPLEGVPGASENKGKVILAQFDIVAEYMPPDDRTKKPGLKDVIVHFRAKEDIKIKPKMNSTAINLLGKLLDKLIASEGEEVSDATKVKLATPALLPLPVLFR